MGYDGVEEEIGCRGGQGGAKRRWEWELASRRSRIDNVHNSGLDRLRA